MSKPQPSKRKSIHGKNQLEIKDNVKNDAILTRSKTQESRAQKEADVDGNENDLSALSSDEEISYEMQKRITTEELNAYARLRQQRKRSTSTGNERFDSSPSPSSDALKSIELEVSNNLKKQIKKKDKSNRSSGFEEKQNILNDTVVSHNNYMPSSNVSVNSYIWGILGLVCLAFVVHSRIMSEDFLMDDLSSNVFKCGEDDVECIIDDVKRSLKTMKAKYTHQDDDLWRDVFVGIKNIIRDPKKPSIIVLLGHKNDPLDCLAVLLGNVSSNALNSGLLKLKPNYFENDMGSVITSLRSNIKDKKAVIVWDLLKINEEALKAFHNLCDRINPLVEEVIYIITIIADDYDGRINPLEFVEKKLYKKLSGKIKEDAIQPLITRITDGPILTVKPEPDLLDCPLSKASN